MQVEELKNQPETALAAEKQLAQQLRELDEKYTAAGTDVDRLHDRLLMEVFKPFVLKTADNGATLVSITGPTETFKDTTGNPHYVPAKAEVYWQDDTRCEESYLRSLILTFTGIDPSQPFRLLLSKRPCNEPPF